MQSEIGKNNLWTYNRVFFDEFFKPIFLNVSYYTTCENIRKPYVGFMMFSGRIKREHWEDMG